MTHVKKFYSVHVKVGVRIEKNTFESGGKFTFKKCYFVFCSWLGARYHLFCTAEKSSGLNKRFVVFKYIVRAALNINWA